MLRRLDAMRTAMVVSITLAITESGYAVETERSAIELNPGEYELTASADTRAKATRSVTGQLSLRNLVPVREIYGTPYRLYGWSNVDFRALGAPVASPKAASSQDPENPGVLVWEPPPWSAELLRSMNRGIVQPPGAPIMLIGTLQNRQATRGMRDGSGIGLFIEAKRGECVLGRWTHFGIAMGAEGSFIMCRREELPPNKALNPTGHRPAG